MVLYSILGQDFSNRMSVAAMDSLLSYMLDRLDEHHSPRTIDLETLRLLLLHPHYISLPNRAKIRIMLCYTHLRPNLGDEGFLGFVEGIPVEEDHLYVLHGIQQVYSMHGADGLALKWFHTISRALPLVSKWNGAKYTGVATESGESMADVPRRTHFVQMLATTYIASFGRRSGRFANVDPEQPIVDEEEVHLLESEPPLSDDDVLAPDGPDPLARQSGRFALTESEEPIAEEKEPQIRERSFSSSAGYDPAAIGRGQRGKSRLHVQHVSSTKAMAFFDQIRTMSAEEASSGMRRFMGSPDIYAWTALLTIASRDTKSVTTEALSHVFRRLQREGEPNFGCECLTLLLTCHHTAALPRPNTVTYTVLISGLIARGQAERAIKVFEDDFIPQAQAGFLPLDTQILQEYMSALIAEDRLEAAIQAMHYYGKSSQAFDSEQSILDAARSKDPLRASLQLDVHLLNRHMTALANHGQYLAVYNLYKVMDLMYAVIPDEITLSILAKAVITRGLQHPRENIPSGSEDSFPIRGTLQSDASQLFRWDKERPAAVVADIFWTMLRENFPLATGPAEASITSSTRRFLFGQPSPSIPLSPKTLALRRQPDEPAISLQYPYLYPSPTNMHLFIAILGYFSQSSQIPLVLAYMKELSIRPTRKTLCLALWSFEEGGAMTGERLQVLRWLSDWLGLAAIPTDEELGSFRQKQWGSGHRS